MSYKITWHNSDVIIYFDGFVNFKDIFDIDNILYGDSRFDNMKYQLFDFSKTEQFEVNEDEIEAIGNLDKSASQWNNHIKLALVALDQNLLAMIKVYVEAMQDTNWTIQVFTDFDDAKAWCTA